MVDMLHLFTVTGLAVLAGVVGFYIGGCWGQRDWHKNKTDKSSK